MKTLSALLITMVAAATIGGSAQAADLILDAPAVATEAVASDWTGAYIGVQAGVISLTTVEDYDPAYSTPVDPYWELGAYGGTVGFFAGYDFQVDDMFVLGISGEVNLDDAAIDYDGYDDYMTMDWDAAIKVRGGMLVNPSTLLYATVGYGVAGFTFSDDYWGGSYGPDDSAGGWIVGAGVETEVTDGLFVRGEASATFYDDLEIEWEDEPYYLVTPTVVKATLGLAYKF